MAVFEQFKRQTSSNHKNMLDSSRAWVSTGAEGAWRKFWTSPLAPVDFEVLKGAFKYYVIKEVGGWGQKIEILDDLQYCKSSKSWMGGPKKVKIMMT